MSQYHSPSTEPQPVFTTREGTILGNLLHQRKDAVLAAHRTDPSHPSETASTVAELDRIAEKVRKVTQ